MAGHIHNLVSMTGPATAIQEILYGFIMALIFVNAASFGILSFSGPVEFVLVIFGMNATWGVIDAIILYYMAEFNQRGYKRVISGANGLDREQRRKILVDGFSGTPLDVLPDDEKNRICEGLLDKELESDEEFRSSKREYLFSSIGCIIFSISTVIPFAVTILLIADFTEALLVAKILASAILFFVGYALGPHIGINRYATGIFLMGSSLIIAIISTFTGG